MVRRPSPPYYIICSASSDISVDCSLPYATISREKPFQDKIIPLLQEYFYGDYKKIYYVLGPGFVEKKKGKTIFAVDVTNDEYDFDIPEEKYEIKTESFDIQKAIEDLKVQS